MVSSHPAQAAAKPRLSDGAGLLDGFQSRLVTMDGEFLEERTVFKIGPLTWVKRKRPAKRLLTKERQVSEVSLGYAAFTKRLSEVAACWPQPSQRKRYTSRLLTEL